MRIGVDIMGSDVSPHDLYCAILRIAQEDVDALDKLVVFVSQKVADHLPPITQNDPIELRICSEFITMEDHPLHSIRIKKDSTMCVGIEQLLNREIDAFVTAGNTGALIAKSKLTIPVLSGVFRPALLAVLPTEKGGVAVVDVGGNVTCKPTHLVQFAHMGAAYKRCISGIETPTVGFLNIGCESSRGTEEIKAAYRILEKQCNERIFNGEKPIMQFVGNVEGRDVFRHAVDVLVTDGFTGNVLLKTTEGVSAFIFDHFQSETLKQIRKRFDYAEYPGAVLCGLERVVIKCHGDASELSMYSSIKGAISLVNCNLIQRLVANTF